MGCDHLYSNNDDVGRIGCRAFPEGIPKNKIGMLHTHDVVIDGQNGEYVYMPAKKTFNKRGRKIKIYQ